MPSTSRTYRSPLRLAALSCLGVGTVVGGLLTFVFGLGFAFVVFGLIEGEGHRLIGALMALIYVSFLGAPMAGWVTFAFDRYRSAIVLGAWPVVAGAAIIAVFATAPRG